MNVTLHDISPSRFYHCIASIPKENILKAILQTFCLPAK
ncbi:hypothetical protein QSI_0076 [Clostridioides difficile P28]|nr:hypothetical protein QSI_0076 [Clostridioides difficile P28]